MQGGTTMQTTGSQRRTWREKILTIKIFTVISYFVLNNVLMFNYALAGVITAIERRFHFDSTTMGRVILALDLGPLGGLLFFSYFANRFNLARVTGIMAIIYSIGITLFTLPQYIFGYEGSNTETVGISHTILCINATGKNHLTRQDETESGTPNSNSTAFGIMFAALLLAGVTVYPVMTLPQTYIEWNTRKSHTTTYIAIANLGWATSPLFGLLLSAWCMSLYVDLSDTQLTPDDHTWIGAWWLAIVIVAVLVIIPSLFYFFFPKSIEGEDTDAIQLEHPDGDEAASQTPSAPEVEFQVAENADNKANNKDAHSFKGFLFSMKRLILNPVYVLSVCGYVLWAQFIWSFQAFSPKVIQEVYSMAAWEASIVGAVVIGIGATIGQVSSGVLSSCLKISLRKNVQLVITLTGVTSVLMLGAVFMGCDNVDVVGTPEHSSGFIVNQHCASQCDCSTVPYSPICDADRTYFSPCHAGCLDTNATATNQNVYTECSCTEAGTGIRCVCEVQCNMLIPYGVIVFLVFMLTVFTLPHIIVFTMRCVEPKDMSLAFGLNMFCVGIVGFVPAPILSGSVIDTACIVWEDQGGGVQGSCWIYDIVALRQRFHGLGAGQRFLQFLCFAIAYILARNKFEMWEARNSDETQAANQPKYTRRYSVSDAFNAVENERETKESAFHNISISA